MKIFAFRYDPDGALIRFGDEASLFADLRAWPSLGEDRLEDQITQIAEGKCSDLFLKRARRFSTWWEQALPLCSPPSYHLEHQTPLLKTWNVCKLKVRQDTPEETLTDWINKQFQLGRRCRLDFNGQWSSTRWNRWWQQLSPNLRESIDYCEDPWKPAPTEHSEIPFGKLACDFYQYPSSGWKILKPARGDHPSHCKSNQKWVATTYLGHPLGMITDWLTIHDWVSEGFFSEQAHGLVSCLQNPHTVPFLGSLERHQNSLIFSSNTHRHWQTLLNEIPWESAN